MITRRGGNLEAEIKHHWDRSVLNLAIVRHRVQMQDHARSLELLTNNQLQTQTRVSTGHWVWEWSLTWGSFLPVRV